MIDDLIEKYIGIACACFITGFIALIIFKGGFELGKLYEQDKNHAIETTPVYLIVSEPAKQDTILTGSLEFYQKIWGARRDIK